MTFDTDMTYHFFMKLLIDISFLAFKYYRYSLFNTHVIMAPDQPSIIHGPSAPTPVSMTFGQLISHHARDKPNSDAVISHHQGIKLTYKELDDSSTALAKSFRGYNVGKRDTVAIMLGSRTEYLEVGI
jgi:non-ribosomal peptide synthetase component F